jgi:protein FRA10AC1
MSWKTSGRLLSGPPSANHTDAASDPSNFSASVGSRLKPNLGGLTAFQREQQLAARYGDYARVPEGPMRSEWDVLRENHRCVPICGLADGMRAVLELIGERFIRDDEEPENVSWEERLARAYESKLFKEFALVSRFLSPISPAHVKAVLITP